MIQRHESFRTSFEMVEGEPVQIVHEEFSFEVEYYEQKEANSKNNINDTIKGFIRPFDLSKAPLLRIGIIKITDNEHILLSDMSYNFV